MKNIRILVALLGLTVINAYGQETVFGEGRVAIAAGDAASVRNAAKQEALRDAVLKAILDATAINASDAKYAQIVADLGKQLRDVQVREERREGADFVTRLEVFVDRRAIKNAIRGTELDKAVDRNFSILLLVDEYITSSRDLNMPVEEMEEFKYDAGASYKNKSVAASSSKSASASSLAASSSLNASSADSRKVSGSAQSSVAVNARDGAGGSVSGAATQQANLNASSSSATSVQAKDSLAASRSASDAKTSIDKKDIESSSHLKASYKRLVKYQDNSVPSGRSMFLNGFSGHLREYDLRMLDATTARSQFFGDKKLSLNTLANSAEMAKFNEFARTKAKADFLLVGNAVVISADTNPATGQLNCAVQVELKAYSTSSAELIASDGISTMASGPNIDACASVGTQKIARLAAPTFASRVLGYWADRAARGRQYIVELKGGTLALPVRLAFAKAIREMPGASGFEKRDDSADLVQVTLTLKGVADVTESVVGALMANPVFASREMDAKSEGELLTICLGSCGPVKAVEKPAAKGPDRKKR